MGCEDQKILLEIYKLQVASYCEAVKFLNNSTEKSADEYLRRCDVATEALESCLVIFRSLNDHVEMHGCRMERGELFGVET